MSDRKERCLKNCCRVIFVLYLLFLTKIILFKYRGFAATLHGILAGGLSGFRSYNIVPFRSILEFAKLMLDGYFSRSFDNLVGNILVFAPLGYFLPLLHKKCRDWKRVASLAFLVSVSFEVLQYVLYLGSADVDDVLLNLSGALAGFLFFRGIERRTDKKLARRYAATIGLSAIGFLAAGYVAVAYFGLMFGIPDPGSQGGLSAEGSVQPGEWASDGQVGVISEGGQDGFDSEADEAQTDAAETDGAEVNEAETDAVKTDEADEAETDAAKTDEADEAEADGTEVNEAETDAAQTDEAKADKAEGNKAGSEEAFAMYGMIMELLDSGVVINRVKEEDLGNGKGVASINLEEPDAQTVYLTENTNYAWKDIYDVNGDKVEIREAAKEDLEIDRNIDIKGYRADGKFYAAEITIENFLF